MVKKIAPPGGHMSQRGTVGGSRRLAVVVLAALASLAASGIARAAPKWLPPQVIAPATGVNASAPGVLMDGDGATFAWWNRGGVEQALQRPAGAAFGAPLDLSVAGSVPATADVEAGGLSGRLAAAWSTFDGVNTTIRASVREP